MITVIRSIEEWNQYRTNDVGDRSLGFVPTMGGLHEGHCSLAERSLSKNDFTAVSIFLNRTQFNKAADYDSYPADFAQDVGKLEILGVDAVFAPDYDSMYPDSYNYRVSEHVDSLPREGARRPGHFDGVLTVVMKLLNISGAGRAYFGEKDYQQLQLVKGMVDTFFMPIEIVSCETVRAFDGLALSSRNRRLSDEARTKAATFPQILSSAQSSEEAIALLEDAGFEMEYVEEEDGRRFGAVTLEGVRLIDNWKLAVAAPR